MKGAGVLTWAAIFSYFVSSDWQWAFGIVPLYWPAKVLWMLEAGETGTWFVLVVGLLYQALLLVLLLRRYNRVVRR